VPLSPTNGGRVAVNVHDAKVAQKPVAVPVHVDNASSIRPIIVMPAFGNVAVIARLRGFETLPPGR